MGKARRQRMDEEFERVVESSAAKYTSHPFTKGKHTISRTWVYWRVSEGFQPSKIDTEAMWSHTVSKVFPSKPSSEQNRPSVVLKEADSVLASSGSARSAYKMPPGTSRTRKYQESYVRETERNI